MQLFFDQKSFAHLSLHDLVKVRDSNHALLLSKTNVVATAIGLYRILKSDPWPDSWKESTNGPHHKANRKKAEPRRLDNSEVRPYSWPSILVFVEKWLTADRINHENDEKIPSFLIAADGTRVPVCVVEAPRQDIVVQTFEDRDVIFPQNRIGGGFPLICDVQGVEHIASVGCLVSDGHKTYALTNRHVAGNAGEPVFTMLGNAKTEIGKSAGISISRELFSDVYPGWEGSKSYLNMDVGLIEIYDANIWKTDVYNLGELGPTADLSVENISLSLIGLPVKAYGSASGIMKGEIQGLFYRYKAIGGFEYVSDFLIGPRQDGEQFATHHGDSGTLWVTDDGLQDLMPVALQWGMHELVEGGGKMAQPYALATCLSNVCNLLDMDIVRGWNTDDDYSWGTVGHYTIASWAVNCLDAKSTIGKFFVNNLENISFPTGKINKKNTSGLSKNAFVPLADVPDLVWKMRGGTYARGGEGPNHFADMDKEGPNGTLLDICKNKNNIDVDKWLDYYHSVGDTSYGCLPFRVWQLFNQMVKSAGAGKADEFLCAAGVLSHYMGDACQPLHISYMHDGIPDGKQVTGKGVHGAYEDDMVNTHISDIMAGLQSVINNQNKAKAEKISAIASGHDAATAAVELMQRTFNTIKPKDIVDMFIANGKGTAASNAMYQKFGDDTQIVMARGARYLAAIWTAAWQQGRGDSKMKSSAKIDSKSLSKLYQAKTFVPSTTLKNMKSSGVLG